MDSLQTTRQKFTLVVAVLGVLNLLLIAYVVWPGSSPSAKRAQEQALKEKVDALESEVAPTRGIETKLKETSLDVKKFYEKKVPSQFSQISQHLEKLVKDTGVTTQSIHYGQDKIDHTEKGDLPEVARIHIDTTVAGEYSKVARFINALEQDQFVFVIDQITLTGQENSGTVSLQIKCETFLREI